MEKELKKMKPVIIFKTDKNIKENVCARQIKDAWELEKSYNNKNEPIWLQKVSSQKFKNKYYIIFAALGQSQGVAKFLNKKK